MNKIKSKFIYIALLLFFDLTSFCLDLEKMEIHITKRSPLIMVPSASGIEYISTNFYVIGDNAPWLYKLNEKLELISKTAIYSLKDLESEVIPKPAKPDFEAMALVKSKIGNELYIFGSGSKSPTRNILIKTNLEQPDNYSSYDLTNFYKLLKKNCNLTAEEINIEGAFATSKNLYLLNRGNNLIIWFKIKEFNSYIAEKSDSLTLNFHSYELPTVKNVQAGFSGATYVEDRNLILFTASIENTENWIDDGEVLGSYVGAIELDDLTKSSKPICMPITENGLPVSIKIESIALNSNDKKKISLFLVTDSDGGTSELIEACLLF